MHQKLIYLLILFTVSCSAKETRKKVAILDTGIDRDFPSQYLCSEGHKDFTGEGLQDYVHHGSHLAYIIKNYINPRKECILVLKFYDHLADFHSTPLVKAYKYLQTIDIDFLNISFGGKVFAPVEKETMEILLNKGVEISNAAGNSSQDLSKSCNYYPACYNFKNQYYHVVASCKDGVYSEFSNYNGPTTDCNNGEKVHAGPYIFSGTSQSTAIQTGKNVENSRKLREFHDR